MRFKGKDDYVGAYYIELDTPAMSATLERVMTMVEEKNNLYGNSALEPLGLLTDCDARTGRRVRIEDKLKRWRTTGTADGEDVLLDIIGYCVLELVDRATKETYPIEERLMEVGTLLHSANMAFSGGAKARIFAPAWTRECQAAVVDWWLCNVEEITEYWAILTLELVRLYTLVYEEVACALEAQHA